MIPDEYAVFCIVHEVTEATRRWNKDLQVQQALARVMLRAPDGDRLPTVTQLCRDFGVGSGTVQSAMRALADQEAVSIVARGHLGTAVVSRNLCLLWQLSGAGPLECSMPLPMSLEITGLAAAFHAVADELRVQLRFSFSQGIRRRFKALEDGRTDVVVGSTTAVASLVRPDDRVLDLNDYSFYAMDSVVVLTRSGESVDRRGRVPIDRNSLDHSSLTKAEFPEAKFVDAAYTMVPELLVRGDVDAAVWHRTSASPLLNASGVDMHPLEHLSPTDLAPVSRASLLVADGERGAGDLIDLIVRDPLFQQVQREVIDQKRTPEY